MNYPLAPNVSIDQIVSSSRKALNWLATNGSSFNGDADQIYIAGHSAGGHLAAMLMVKNPEQAENFDVANIKGVCTLSGLFNLHPIQLSEINEGLQMDETIAVRNSPVRLMPSDKCSLLVAVGGDETTEFKDQSNELYNCWKEHIPVKFCDVPGTNHFSILAELCDPHSSLHKDFCNLMNI